MLLQLCCIELVNYVEFVVLLATVENSGLWQVFMFVVDVNKYWLVWCMSYRASYKIRIYVY